MTHTSRLAFADPLNHDVCRTETMTSNFGFSLAKELFVVDADFQCEASLSSCVLSALNSEI